MQNMVLFFCRSWERGARELAFEHYVNSNGRRLRCGYTTGTCAALAARGRPACSSPGQAPERVSLRTPKGWVVEVPVESPRLEGGTGVLLA